MKALAKALAWAVLGSRPAVRARLHRHAVAGSVTILNFHRVAPFDNSAYPPLDPKLFETVIAFVAQYYRVVDFAELANLVGDPGAVSGKARAKPLAIVSFDDGYRDFIDHALPVLRQHGIRANQNFIPGCIEAGKPPFNVILQDWIGQAPQEMVAALFVPGFGLLGPTDDREATGNRVSAFVKSKPIAHQRQIAATVADYLARFDEFRPTPMMTLADVHAVAAEVEVGAHSFDHATLATEEPGYATEDARRCRDWFTRNLGSSTTIYAVPNGAVREDQLGELRSEGFTTILLVGERRSSPASRDHPRFTMYGTGSNELIARASGFVR